MHELEGQALVSLARTAFGAQKRQREQSEKRAAYLLEDLFRIHRLDFWHPTVSQMSQAGWPDYVVLGDGFHAFLELKASNAETGRRGKLSAAQHRYREAIERAGGVRHLLPARRHGGVLRLANLAHGHRSEAGMSDSGHDQPGWHPWWRAFSQLGDRTVVLLNNPRLGMWYVCEGKPGQPCLSTEYDGLDETVARVMFDALCELMRETPV